ncbi:MAG: sulfurtransferase TusA family protein [Sphingomonas sp.]|nr:sulfurtransferase TusA family protein [Sphingomonas sp.]
MRCPWPALRLARALREGADTVEVLADDPRAPEELAAVAAGAGAHFIATEGAFRVTRAAPVNPSFTA